MRGAAGLDPRPLMSMMTQAKKYGDGVSMTSAQTSHGSCFNSQAYTERKEKTTPVGVIQEKLKVPTDIEAPWLRVIQARSG